MVALPEVGAMSPSSARRVVVLPDPFGPEEAGDGPGLHAEAEVVDRPDLAVVLDEVLDLDEGHELSPCHW